MNNLKERIQALINAMSAGLHERDEHVAVILLAALSGQNIFLLGPPGTAKSLLARRLASVFDGKCFEYLMQRFSTPEEIFGPVSIAELKNDKYVRKTEGFLPTADFTFLDEIWKANPGILNTLLTVINEKEFRNGTEVKKVPLKAAISASNETPPPKQGLEALYDRFVVRLHVPPVENVHHFNQMLDEEPADKEAKNSSPISTAELDEWREKIKTVKLSDDTKDIIQLIRRELSKLSEKSKEDVFVSDRRWQQAAILLKAGAFFCGRVSTNLVDTMLLRHCLWTTNDDRERVIGIVEDAVKSRGFRSEIDTARLYDEKAKLEDHINNDLYKDKISYKTFPSGDAVYYKAAVYYSQDSDPNNAHRVEFYIDRTRDDNFYPLSVGENARDMKELVCTFQKQGSYTVSARQGCLFEKDNSGLHQEDEVHVVPEKLVRKVRQRHSSTIDNLVEHLEGKRVVLAKDFVRAISEIEEKKQSFAQEIFTPFVPKEIRDIALKGVESQLNDLHSAKDDCILLSNRIAGK